MKAPIFTGVCPALVTPFHESGRIDYHAFAKLIDYQIGAGVDAVCVCGTTGEASTLTPAEQTELIRFCVEHTAGRVPVIAGTGSNSTGEAIEKSCRAQLAGADALLIVTPYYNKATQTGLIRHYEAIAASTDIPILLYNVPGRTGVSFTAETYAALSRLPKINGVKEASGNLSLIIQTRKLCPDDFYIWSGNDDQIAPVMALGAKGVVSVAANIIPEVMVELSHKCLSGDYEAAAALQIEYAELIDTLFSEVNPIPIKAAMELLGMCSGRLRLPLCPISQAHLERLHSELRRLRLL